MIVTLYTTLGCHLCEEARGLLDALTQELSLEIESVEIAASDDLMEKYGIRIPVVKKGQQELGWPFTLEELHTFLCES